jgi:predicted aspartyl protease
MGEVIADVGIWTADGSAMLPTPMTADTGATYCQLPANILRALGWEPDEGQRTYTLADGSERRVGLGKVKIRLDGTDSDEYFLFGETGGIYLLGVETLQNLSLGVDPVNHRLIRVERES